MTRNINSIISETIGAAIGTGFGVAIVGYGVFSLITNSLEALL